MTKKLEDYKKKMLTFLCRMFPDRDPEVIENDLNNIIEERDTQDENLEIDIKFFDQKSRPVSNVKMSKLEASLEKKKPVITKYGTTYMQHKDKEALESKMLDSTGKKRKAAKKEMFKHLNDEDPTIRKKYNAIQQTYKASIMNSYYGVLTAVGSIFRDLDCGESVTASGEEIIMTAIDTFEKFLSNNFHLYEPSDCIVYMTNIIEEEYESECGNTLSVSKEKLVDYLEDHFYDLDDFGIKKNNITNCDAVMNFIDTLTEEERAKIYYKNNLYQFLYDSKLYKEFDKILSREIPFLNPNGPNATKDDSMKDILDAEWKFNKEILEGIWYYVKDWVFYNHLDFNKYAYCKKGKRKSVLVVK